MRGGCSWMLLNTPAHPPSCVLSCSKFAPCMCRLHMVCVAKSRDWHHYYPQPFPFSNQAQRWLAPTVGHQLIGRNSRTWAPPVKPLFRRESGSGGSGQVGPEERGRPDSSWLARSKKSEHAERVIIVLLKGIGRNVFCRFIQLIVISQDSTGYQPYCLYDG